MSKNEVGTLLENVKVGSDNELVIAGILKASLRAGFITSEEHAEFSDWYGIAVDYWA